MFESFAVSEIIKSFTNAGIDPRLSLYHYKDGEKIEIDLVIKRGGVLYPVEIKKSGGGEKKDIAAFELLKEGSLEVGKG